MYTAGRTPGAGQHREGVGRRVRAGEGLLWRGRRLSKAGCESLGRDVGVREPDGECYTRGVIPQLHSCRFVVYCSCIILPPFVVVSASQMTDSEGHRYGRGGVGRSGGGCEEAVGVNRRGREDRAEGIGRPRSLLDQSCGLQGGNATAAPMQGGRYLGAITDQMGSSSLAVWVTTDCGCSEMVLWTRTGCDVVRHDVG